MKTTTMSVTDPATITTSSLTVDNSVVQEYTEYILAFTIPVPLNAGCVITIQFPSEITLDSQLTTVTGSSFFGGSRTMTGTADYNANTYTITNGCPSYEDNTFQALLYFQQIQNPFE